MPMTILFLGGSGMLLPAVEKLCSLGQQVAVVSRHASSPEVSGGAVGEIIPIDADWSKPELYCEAVIKRLEGQVITGMVVWVHRPYRGQIVPVLAKLLTRGGRVVRLWGSSSGDPRCNASKAPKFPELDVCELYLGAWEIGRERFWLTHDQISDAAVKALYGSMSELVVGTLGS